MGSKSCFGAYDIRGIYPDQVNEDIAYRIGRLLPGLLKGKSFAIGHDMRLSGQSLSEALAIGLKEAGCEVYDIGLCGTEMIYFAVPHLSLDGGIMITASHNPKEYNGMKFVTKNSAPIEKEVFRKLKCQVREGNLPSKNHFGTIKSVNIMPSYVKKILSYIDIKALKPYRVVVNIPGPDSPPIRHKETVVPAQWKPQFRPVGNQNPV